MKVLLGSDEHTPLIDFVHEWLLAHGHEVTLSGHTVHGDQKWHWAKIGLAVGEAVSDGDADVGIAFCWSGTGVSMAANRYPHARAALCWDAETARLARKWDNANILNLSLRYTTPAVAEEILTAWFSTQFDEEDLHQVELLSI